MGGFLIVDKFEQFRRSLPASSFSALVEAADHLCRQVSHRDDRDELVSIIKSALGVEMGSLSLWVPQLCNLLELENGSVHQSEEGCSYERLVALYRSLIISAASRERPLVMFLDDIHWGDSDSLKLIQSLLFQLGAYRDDQVDESHELSTTLKRIDAMGGKATSISLGCMTEDSVNALVAFATELGEEETAPLSNLIHQKTQVGNGFFTIQFLKMLQDDNLLHFSFQNYKWSWNLEEVRAKTRISDNVLGLVVGRITKLNHSAQEVFRIAGLLGLHFSIDVLNIVISDTKKKSQVELNAKESEENRTRGLVEKLLSMNLFEKGRENWLKFSHDCVQQAAESCFREELDKHRLSLTIGRILRDHMTVADTPNSDWLFLTAIDRLNEGSSLVTNETESLR